MIIVYFYAALFLLIIVVIYKSTALTEKKVEIIDLKHTEEQLDQAYWLLAVQEHYKKEYNSIASTQSDPSEIRYIMEREVYRRTNIAGINFRKDINPGYYNAVLIPEPENETDPNSIKIVSTEGTHLGYVPAAETNYIRTIAKLDYPYPAIIVQYRENEDCYVGTLLITRTRK